MPSPSAFHFFRLNAAVDPKVYPDAEQYWEDLIEVYRAEIADLAALGCSYIQLDEVPLAMLCDPSIQEQVRGMGGDPQALIRPLCRGARADSFGRAAVDDSRHPSLPRQFPQPLDGGGRL